MAGVCWNRGQGDPDSPVIMPSPNFMPLMLYSSGRSLPNKPSVTIETCSGNGLRKAPVKGRRDTILPPWVDFCSRQSPSSSAQSVYRQQTRNPGGFRSGVQQDHWAKGPPDLPLFLGRIHQGTLEL
jgi:hypothetical protein